ncbi:hypothetical protein [Streptomyces sp. NPDC046261]|uniref:hypothetical protein n=1 Tax=Streptomyces sp. NPDC046261 TaxID=3157200 RepID=UPI0033F4F5AB
MLVGALCLLDLLLTVGLIRRLRAQPAPRTAADRFADDGMLPPGALVGAFETRTVDGRPLHSRDLGTGTVVVFLSPGCPPCHEQLPRVAAALGAAPARRAVAVVAGGADGDAETEQMLKELGPVARVVHESGTGPVTEAFAVRGFPAMCRVRAAGDELVVEAVGEHVLPAPLPAAS